MIKVYVFRQFKFRGIKTQLENKTIVRGARDFHLKTKIKNTTDILHLIAGTGIYYYCYFIFTVEIHEGIFFTFLLLFLFLFYDLDRVFCRSSRQRYIITGT